MTTGSIVAQATSHASAQRSRNSTPRPVSWLVPTEGLGTACFPLGSPGHSWQNTASIGSPIGHKGMMVAAKVLALSLADLLSDAAVLKEAKADFDKRIGSRKYTTRIPDGQKAPKTIR